MIETKKDLIKIKNYLDNFNQKQIKLYLSCINECPFEGKINKKIIIDEIKWHYENIKPDILCLSDTCGTLTNDEFINIIDNCKVPYNLLGIHLHFDKNNEIEVVNILKTCFDRKIKYYDVSLIESGGCSLTINNPKKNLTYDLFNKTLDEYLQLL